MVDKQSGNKKGSSDPGKWVDLYGDHLYRFALARVYEAEAAEDLVQETFLAALRGREGFEGRSSEKTWLIAILKNKIVDYIRKRSRETPVDDTEVYSKKADEFFDEKGHWTVKPQKWSEDPMKLLERKEFRAVFSKCLSELPERLRQAFTLREMEGLRCADICNVLDITASNCWVMLYRARMFMRRCLEIKWVGAQ